MKPPPALHVLSHNLSSHRFEMLAIYGDGGCVKLDLPWPGGDDRAARDAAYRTAVLEALCAALRRQLERDRQPPSRHALEIPYGTGYRQVVRIGLPRPLAADPAHPRRPARHAYRTCLRELLAFLESVIGGEVDTLDGPPRGAVP